MKWQEMNVNVDSDLFITYQKKYGLNSDYQKDQEKIYSQTEIFSSLHNALSLLKIEPGNTILDIGINNGCELSIIKGNYPIEVFESLNIIGFDLARNVLDAAQEHFKNITNYKFVVGDIRKFEGMDIRTTKQLKIEEKSIDIVFALLSLQSSSIINEFDYFLKELVFRLKSSSQLFIGLPNCHISDFGEISLGLFNANTQKVDNKSAIDLSSKLERELSSYGFTCQKFGTLVIFHYFERSQK